MTESDGALWERHIATIVASDGRTAARAERTLQRDLIRSGANVSHRFDQTNR